MIQLILILTAQLDHDEGKIYQYGEMFDTLPQNLTIKLTKSTNN